MSLFITCNLGGWTEAATPPGLLPPVKPFIIHFSDKASIKLQQICPLAKAMILIVLVFASNFVFTWVIPTACVCA